MENGCLNVVWQRPVARLPMLEGKSAQACLLLQCLGHRRCALTHEIAAHERSTLLASQLPLADDRRHAQLHDHLFGHLGALVPS